MGSAAAWVKGVMGWGPVGDERVASWAPAAWRSCFRRVASAGDDRHGLGRGRRAGGKVPRDHAVDEVQLRHSRAIQDEGIDVGRAATAEAPASLSRGVRPESYAGASYLARRRSKSNWRCPSQGASNSGTLTGGQFLDGGLGAVGMQMKDVTIDCPVAIANNVLSIVVSSVASQGVTIRDVTFA